MKNNKAQGWGFDLTFAVVIFIIIIVIIFIYALNLTNSGTAHLQSLFNEANTASEIILNEPFPGIVTNFSIDQQKLENFYNQDYNNIKKEIGLKDNFYFTFPGMNIGGNPISEIGIVNPPNVANIVKITRVTVYNNKPVKFELYVWRNYG
ncbi:MAG: hypothetical protein QXI33_03620 [Candidatus Pacearchaeota archaeon]